MKHDTAFDQTPEDMPPTNTTHRPAGRRDIVCPKCGEPVRLPWAWIFGVEMVLRCPGCKMPFKTGYKMGALLFGCGLALAAAAANLGAWLTGSIAIPIWFVAIFPLWIWFGFLLRRAHLRRKCRHRSKNNDKV